MKSKYLYFCFICLLFLPNCASLTTGTTQELLIKTKDKNGTVTDASCKCSNDKGTYYFVGSGLVTVKRDKSDLLVECSKGNAKGYARALAYVAPENVHLGCCLIGVHFDEATGAIYKYQWDIIVVME